MGNVSVSGGGTGDGDITGPGSSTDNAIARFDGTSGDTLQNSSVLIDDANAVSGAASLVFSGGGATISEFSTDGTLAGNSDTAVPTEQAVKTYVTDTTPAREYYYDAAALHATESGIPALTKVSGSNLNAMMRSYSVGDETTGKLFLTSTLEASTTVQIKFAVASATAAASKNTKWRFSYYTAGDGDSWDGVYVDEDSSDVGMSGTQNVMTFSTISFALPAAWTAGELLFFKFERLNADSDELSGAARLLAFELTVERGV